MIWTTVVVGMKLEARIAQRSGARVICSANNPLLATLLARAAVAREPQGVVSFGVAGGLAPNLRPGTWIVGSEILYGTTRVTTDRAWSNDLLERIPDAIHGVIAGAATPIAKRDDKRALHIETGAVAVDMESHIVAGLAARYGLRMVALRVIIDPAERTLPEAALAAFCPNGNTDVAAMIRSAMERPREIPGLLRTALDAIIAGTALVRKRRILDSHIALAGGR